MNAVQRRDGSEIKIKTVDISIVTGRYAIYGVLKNRKPCFCSEEMQKSFLTDRGRSMSISAISKLPPPPTLPPALSPPVAASRVNSANDDRLALEQIGNAQNTAPEQSVHASDAKLQEANLKMQEAKNSSKELNKNHDLLKYTLAGLTGSTIGSATAVAGKTDIQASENGGASSDGGPKKASGEVAGNSSVSASNATASDVTQNAAGAAAELGRQALSIANLNPHQLSALIK